nr:aminopeptidase [Evansella caseinilytica]
MAANEGESLLVVTDNRKREIAGIFAAAGKELGLETMMIVMEERKKSGEEPPVAVKAAMGSADIVLCITEHSLTHTEARKDACRKGAKVATMPGITMDMLSEGAITADFLEVKEVTERVTAFLDNGKEVKLEKDGKTLSFSIAGRKGINSTGMFTEPSASGNLPSGESYIAPVETSGNGEMAVDGSIAGIGVLNEAMIITISDGRLVQASGSKLGAKLLNKLGDGEGRTLCEFGIGTNNKARVTGNVLEDEKVYGTVHLAFGSNHTFGGTVNAGVHIDCVIHRPNVFIDGRLIMENGKLLI